MIFSAVWAARGSAPGGRLPQVRVQLHPSWCRLPRSLPRAGTGSESSDRHGYTVLRWQDPEACNGVQAATSLTTAQPYPERAPPCGCKEPPDRAPGSSLATQINHLTRRESTSQVRMAHPSSGRSGYNRLAWKDPKDISRFDLI